MTADRSRIVQVVVWLLFLCAVVGVCARLGTRWAMTRKVFLDDVLIIVAQVCQATALLQSGRVLKILNMH